MNVEGQTAAFLNKALEFSGKSQKEIAREVGFPKPNVVSMMKTGETKIPLDRIPALARACLVDPVYFLRLALEEYQPEIWQVLVNTLGHPLTENEWEIVGAYRIASLEAEVEMTAERVVRVLEALDV